MEENYLDKKITFENGKLYCNGQEISIEEAEEIIKKQVKQLEKKQEEIVKQADDLDEDRTRRISNRLNEIFVYSSNSGIYVRGNNEYYEAADLIMQANLICEKALRLFSPEYIREKKRKKAQKDNLKSIISNSDWNGTEPSNLDIIEKSIEMYIASVVIIEIKKQFYNIDFNFKQEDIRIYLRLPFEIKVYLVSENFTLFFQINQNIPKIYENIPFNFIISSMIVNGFEIQDNFYQLLKENTIISNNNIKFSQTLENGIFKEIRFLKNLIKEEIDYSLSMNISRAKERFELSNKILEKYNGLLSEELTLKVNQIIDETKNYENKNSIENTEMDQNKVEEINLSEIIIDNLSRTFNIDKEKITKNLINKDNKYFEINILGQKINIYIDNDYNISLKSISIIAQTKNDIIKDKITGKNINNKICKAINYAYLPILYRHIENTLKNTKILENRKKLREIEDRLKELISFIYEDFNIYENIEFFQEKIFNILDLINTIGRNINLEIFNILDFLLFKLLENISLKDINIIKFRNKISLFYKELYQSNSDFFETIVEIKNLIRRILNICILSIEINIYLDNVFDTSVEDSIRSIINILAEDYICGKTCRTLLSLLDISDTLKDDTFKFQIKNIMLEFINIISS